MHQWLPVEEMVKKGGRLGGKAKAKEIHYFNQSLKFVEVVLVSI